MLVCGDMVVTDGIVVVMIVLGIVEVVMALVVAMMIV